MNLNLSSVDSESDYFAQPYLLVIGVSQTSLMVNNNDLDRNPPIVISSEVCDTPITNNHGGTNTPTQWIDAIAWWRPALCGRNVVINIKVTIVRQTITLNPYLRWLISFMTISILLCVILVSVTWLNWLFDVCNSLWLWRWQFFVQGWPQVLQPIQGCWKSMLSYLDTMFLRK